MKLTFIGLLALVFFSTCQLKAQQNIKSDSLLRAYQNHKEDTLKVNTLSRLYNALLYTDPETAIKYAREELLLSEKLNFDKGIGMSTYHIGAYYQNSGNIDSARYYLNRSLEVFKEIGEAWRYAAVLNSLASLEYVEGNFDDAIAKFGEVIAIDKKNSAYRYAISLGNRAQVYSSKGFYKIALKETLEALRILDTVHNKPWRRADAQRQVGQIEFLRKNYESALNYFKKSLKIYEEQEDNVYIANVSNDIGDTYFHINLPDSSQVYYKKSLELAQVHGIREAEGNAYSGLGKLYLEKGQLDKALVQLTAGLEIQEKNNFKANTLETLNLLGQLYLKQKLAFKALPFLNNTIAQATDEGPITALKDAHFYRSEAYRQLGSWREASNDQLVFQSLNDSIFSVIKSQQIEELRTIYEAEKQEQQIVLQEKEIDILEQEAEISNLQKLLLVGALILALLGFYGVRQKMKRNKLIRERLDAELAFKKKELTTHALHLAKKNEVLEGLKQKAKELEQNEESVKGYSQLIRTIDFDLRDDNNWENFARYFEEVHKDFNRSVKAKYPQLTSNELRLLALLKMNLSSKEIANILNISQDGIKKARYRLRKKLDMATEESLQEMVLRL
ncbi:MAG: tetratricopeptide repeat protein [Flavobacteriaceae bacterium]